jgi:hypothetical protein
MTNMPNSHQPDPGWYDIRVDGHLDARWTAWFDATILTHESDGTTVIRSHVADQAALHGTLHKVRDLGLSLVSVTQIDSGQSPAAAEGPLHLITPETLHEGD